jgi:hypothetical protein
VFLTGDNMKKTKLLYSIFIVFFIFPTAFPQSKTGIDSLYEQLKHKNINKMTQREYEYFMLIKSKEINANAIKPDTIGTLTGVVTYFFNRNYGDKPDVGSEVFIIPAQYQKNIGDVILFQSEVLSRANDEMSRVLGMNETGKRMPKSKYDSLETRVYEFIKQLKDKCLPDVNKVIADGAGSFSISLGIGYYYLIAQSAHRSTYSNKVELLGQINVKFADVKANKTVSTKFNFQDR